MKMKYITALIAFAVTFGFSVLLIGVPQKNYVVRTFTIRGGSETARQISLLLQQDEDNSRERDVNFRLASSGDRFAEAVNQYAGECEAIDDANLPSDFKHAWREHVQAWRARADFLNESNFSDEDSIDSEFLQTYRSQDAEITRTWFDVLDVARTYDAAIPPSMY